MGDLPSCEVHTLSQSAVSEVISQMVVSVPLVGSDPAQKRATVSPKAVPSTDHGILSVTDPPALHRKRLSTMQACK